MTRHVEIIPDRYLNVPQAVTKFYGVFMVFWGMAMNSNVDGPDSASAETFP